MLPERRIGCPVEATLAIVGGKWKPLIIYHLLAGTTRFGELRRKVPSATQQMLTLHLRELERDGVVHREVYRQVPPKVEYSLTPLGRSLEPILTQMNDWGARYLRNCPSLAQPDDAAFGLDRDQAMVPDRSVSART